MAFAMRVDEQGLPYSDYGRYRDIEIGRQRSILSVAERGLWCWNEFSLGPDPVLLSYNWNKWPSNREANPKDAAKARRVLEACASWLIGNLVEDEGFAVWEYGYPMPYETRTGWRSAHAQAVGMQLLLRAQAIAPQARYTDSFGRLLAAFDAPLARGGLLDLTEDGLVWFEKLADPNNTRPRILNGMMFAVIGLFDVAKQTGDTKAVALAEVGARTVAATLPRFDLGDWSAHDRFGKRASQHYHAIHIAQLRILHQITGDESFSRWADQFSAYASRPPIR